MVGEDLHGRLGVRIVGRLEAEVFDACKKNVSYCRITMLTALPEELREQSDDVSEREVPLCNDAFYLMELGQVSGVQRLIAVYTVDAEHLRRFESLNFRIIICVVATPTFCASWYS